MGYPLVNALTERSTLGHCSAASRGWWERGGHPEMKTLLSARPNTAVSRSCRFAPVTGPQKAEIAIIGAQSPLEPVMDLVRLGHENRSCSQTVPDGCGR